MSAQDFEFVSEQTKLEVSEFICELMEKHQITREQLADGMNISAARLRNLLNGNDCVAWNLDTITKALYVFGVRLKMGSVPISDDPKVTM